MESPRKPQWVRNDAQSASAVLAGFAAQLGLPLFVDVLLHAMAVFPPSGKPMLSPVLNAIGLSYHLGFAVFGGYLAARLAPGDSMRHAMIVGGIGMVFNVLGGLLQIASHLIPAWVPYALVASGVPCAWLGATLHHQMNEVSRNYDDL